MYSLSRYKLKFSPDKIDTMIVQAICKFPMWCSPTISTVLPSLLFPLSFSLSLSLYPFLLSLLPFSLPPSPSLPLSSSAPFCLVSLPLSPSSPHLALLDDLDKELNNYNMRCREWYGWHFPEMGKIVSDNLVYARTVKAIG